MGENLLKLEVGKESLHTKPKAVITKVKKISWTSLELMISALQRHHQKMRSKQQIGRNYFQ